MDKKSKKIVTGIVGAFVLLLGANIIPGINEFTVLASLWGAAVTIAWSLINK